MGESAPIVSRQLSSSISLIVPYVVRSRTLSGSAAWRSPDGGVTRANVTNVRSGAGDGLVVLQR
jgi:hypothetical protein